MKRRVTNFAIEAGRRRKVSFRVLLLRADASACGLSRCAGFPTSLRHQEDATLRRPKLTCTTREPRSHCIPTVPTLIPPQDSNPHPPLLRRMLVRTRFFGAFAAISGRFRWKCVPFSPSSGVTWGRSVRGEEAEKLLLERRGKTQAKTFTLTSGADVLLGCFYLYSYEKRCWDVFLFLSFSSLPF